MLLIFFFKIYFCVCACWDVCGGWRTLSGVGSLILLSIRVGSDSVFQANTWPVSSLVSVSQCATGVRDYRCVLLPAFNKVCPGRQTQASRLTAASTSTL